MAFEPEPRVFVLSAPIDTPTLSHRPNLTHALQYRVEPDWRHGRLRARSHPQQDEDHQTRVRRRPRVFAFVSTPIDTPTLSPSPSCPSLAVLGAPTLEQRAPLRSPPSSRRRGSPSWGKPPTRVFAFVSAPLTRLLCALLLICSLSWNNIGDEGAFALAAVLNETQITTLKCASALECSLLRQRPLTCLLSHRSLPAPRSQHLGQQHRS